MSRHECQVNPNVMCLDFFWHKGGTIERKSVGKLSGNLEPRVQVWFMLYACSIGYGILYFEKLQWSVESLA